MKVADIIKRAQAKCDDPDGTYLTDDYVMGLMAEAFDWLYGAMKRTNSEFDYSVVVLPAVAAGAPNLDDLMLPGQALAGLLSPKFIRWKIPGTDSVFFREASGPLDFPRDLQDPGIPMLDSWAWVRWSVLLSKFSTPLDLEVTGTFIFPAMTERDDDVKIALNATRALTCKLASEIGKARGNPNWITTYSADADEAVDDINTLLVKEMQKTTHRVGRISRNPGRNNRNVAY